MRIDITEQIRHYAEHIDSMVEVSSVDGIVSAELRHELPPAPRRGWKPAAVVAAAFVAVAVTVGSVSLVLRGDQPEVIDEPPPGPTSSATTVAPSTTLPPSPTASVTTSTITPIPGAAGRPGRLPWSLPVSGGLEALEPGLYTSKTHAFPTVSLEIRETGWRGGAFVCYDRFEGINLTGPSGGKLWVGTTDLGHQPSPIEDAIRFLEEAAVTVNEQPPTTVGGYPTRAFTLEFTNDTSLSRYNWGPPYGDWVPEIDAGSTALAWFVKTDNPNLFILAWAPPAEIASSPEFFDRARSVVNSMRIDYQTPTICGG